MHKNWFDEAWEDYLYWQMQDKKTLKRINMILKEIERHPFLRASENRNRFVQISAVCGADGLTRKIDLCISFVKVLCISFHVGGITNKKTGCGGKLL